jgi:hypothetical protein
MPFKNIKPCATCPSSYGMQTARSSVTIPNIETRSTIRLNKSWNILGSVMEQVDPNMGRKRNSDLGR